MPKTTHTTNTQDPSASRGSSAGRATASPHPERMAKTINFIEIRPGLFLNVDHIVSVRVMPQEDDNAYAILQLSNGDKLNITRGEFTTISGEEPRLATRLLQKPSVE